MSNALGSTLIASTDAQRLLRDVPGLAARLARADHRRDDFLALDDWLLAQHGIPAEAEAALLAATRGSPAAQHGWLKLDALSLVITRDRLVALPQQPEDAADAGQLITDVLAHLPALGALHAPADDAGFALLDLAAPAGARFQPVWRVAGRPLDAHLPDGPRGADWRRWLTEAQMLLHVHPLNEAREARGLRPLNALWLSGGAPSAPPPRAAGVHLIGAHPLRCALPLADVTVAQTLVWLHQPGQPVPAPVSARLNANRLDLRVLETSGSQHYRLLPWHRLRVWRKPPAGSP
jgi:hypothetical protein